MDNNISFSKIVATPTLNSWSQAYNAGKLFAVLSLEKTQELNQDLESLNSRGRDLLEKLEQEFFTIENKDLGSIKKAISNTFDNQAGDIKFSFAAGAFVGNILYLFALGCGKVFIKRGGNFGLVLDATPDPKDIISSSGFLTNNDLIVLATDEFSKEVTNDDLNSNLMNGLPSEIAESLAPKIHKAENGKISAIIIRYAKPQITNTIDTQADLSETPQTEQTVEKPIHPFIKYLSLITSKLKETNFRIVTRRKVFLIVAIIIVGVLISSIYFSIQKENNAKIEKLFSQIYNDAQKKYDEGQSLLDLNKNLARDSFLSAQKILQGNIDKFPLKSKENAQIQDLFKKTEDAVALSSEINRVEARQVSKDANNILNTAINNTQSNFFAQDNNNIYFVNSDSVMSLDIKTKNSKEIIKNDSIWKNVGGIGTYLGNIYVLDKDSKQIFKFVTPGEDFVKTNYFTDDVSPDLSGAKSMAIDGSIWILLADGTIEKFTRGKADSFTVSGLDKPFSNPSRIFTNVDTDNVYILDNGNSRIVVLGKDGVYKSQYQSDALKDAKDFEVREGDKKIFILSGRKIWEIGLK